VGDLQTVVLDLDLDAVGGSGPTTFFESFETAEPGSPFGSFIEMQIDRDLNPPDDDLGNNAAGVLNADGYRCQYSDPDWVNSVSYGASFTPICYPNVENMPDEFFWQIVTERAFSGTAALYFGDYVDAVRGYSTPTSQLEAVRSAEPIHLGWDQVCNVDRAIFCEFDADCPLVGSVPQRCVSSIPALTFKHQVSHIDWRRVNTPGPRAADRSVVQLQKADAGGNPVGDWIKLRPFLNVYDTQANSNYFNCSFDPIDDGNTENSFFDPTDPGRTRGPSSTCAPEFNFSEQGETILPFNADQIGRASDGPGLQGSHGPGTWVEPQFDLNQFRGRSVRLRFLSTGLHLGRDRNWESAFVFNPDPRDDGWFIDDVHVTDVLSEPATVTADLKDNSALPECGVTCSEVNASLSCNGGSPNAVPCAMTIAPGRKVALSAEKSNVDQCMGGVVQYRFWLDSDGNGNVNAPVDELLRDWAESHDLNVAPLGTAAFLVEVRCSTAPECRDVATARVAVDCPVGPDGLVEGSSDESTFLGENSLGAREVRFGDSGLLFWPTAATVDLLRGNLGELRASGSLAGTVDSCLLDNATDASSATTADLPSPGTGYYYLVRSASKCNFTAGGSYGKVGEWVARDAAIGQDPERCPD
jgi:hypothetical protein